MASREKQSVYQKKFENDVKQYNSGGNRKGSSEGSTPSGEAGLLKGDEIDGNNLIRNFESESGAMGTLSL